MPFIPTWNVFPKKAALLCWALWLCGFAADAQTAGLYIHFPDDIVASTCDPSDTTGWGSPAVLPLSNENVGIAYSDQVFLSLPDTCFKVLRTWSVVDWNTYNPVLPLVQIPNPGGLTGPTVSAPGTAAPWAPSLLGGLNYGGFWSANANGYQYVQIISQVDTSSTQTAGLYIHFPDDIVASTCDPSDTTGWGSPAVLPLSNENVGIAYSDQVFLSLPDTCFKVLRTWSVVDWNTYNPVLPLVQIPNPGGLTGPTVSAPGTAAPWAPSLLGGLNYGGFWSANANGYQYVQIISQVDTSSAAGMYIHFPADLVLISCDAADTLGWPQPVVQTLSNASVEMVYQDFVISSGTDFCRKVERTWTIIDWNHFDPGLPFVNVPNPAGLPGPIVSAPGTPAPWAPSLLGGLNYGGLWSATANGYIYKQLITFVPIVCPNDTVLVATPPACSASLDYTIGSAAGSVLLQIAGLPSGSAFPVGATVNTFQVAGATFKCSFTVTVKDLTPPVVHCKTLTTVNIGADSPADCYEGGVAWVNASIFDDGSSDDCGNIHRTIQRQPPSYSDCIQGLNPVNGHPGCDDTAPDSPSEFERAISEQDSIKFYCCEAGTAQQLHLRAYQLNSDGSYATDLNGKPIFSQCIATVQVAQSACGDSIPSLSGYIKLDPAGNCQADVNQIGFSGLVVKMLDSNGDTLYASSGLQGGYRFEAPAAGNAILEVMPPLPLWEICDNPDTLNIPAGAQVFHNFSAHPATECPILTVDLATGLLRPCRTGNWQVAYCNIGGGIAEDAYVQIVAAQPLSLLGASEPFVLNGDTMTVQVGDVAVGGCGAFSVSVFTPCDTSIIGDQLCVEAHIFPDTFCVPASAIWSGAQMETSAVCEGDSVRFTLRNTGSSPTTKALKYMIIDDMVVMLQGEVPAGLPAGAMLQKVVPGNGDLLRLRSEQEPGHPSAQPPSVAVENCNGTTAAGLLLEFENEDGNSFTDLECQEVVSSFDPNEKLAFPRGFSAQHFIEANSQLTYQINFQNTGTDTTFLVVLRDTLSSLLDPASIRVGASSHPFTWSLSGKGILEFRFDPIQLPNASVNEAASHGFVQFKVKQKKNNPIGSHLENRAGIYFDLVNPVVLTNPVWHTIGKDFIATSSVKNPFEAVPNTLHVFPNPATDDAFLVLEGEKTVRVRLLDVMGREVRTLTGKAPGALLRREGLAAGLYFVEVSDGKGGLQTGKLVWK